jgi:phage shock protein PspC (stress-responsive transcriptional regulator)
MTSAPPPAPPVDPPPAWQPPPPPAGPSARPQLRRSRTDKILGGVNGGLAEYSGIDPLLWRVGFVALAFAGGTGVVVYLLLWLLMPAGPPGPPRAEGTAVPAARKRPAGPRSPVPGITMAALLIVIGVLVMIDRLTGADLGPRAFLGSALLVVGLGLIAAARSRGRTARGGLIGLGVVLSLALIASANEPWRGYDGDVGDRIYRPSTAGEVRSEYHGGIGDMEIDLSGVDVSDLDQAIRTRVDAGVGDVTVIVPDDADVRVSIDSGIGSVDVFDEPGRSDGYFAGDGSGSWVGDGDPEIVLTVNAGIGDVEVSRA